jgi:hypothetical protein
MERLVHSDFSKNAIITPVNKNSNSKSAIDYQEQHTRHTQFKKMMWDDAKGNPSRHVGHAFGFVHNGKKVEFHMVTEVCSVDQRLPSWATNVGQGDRNVLMLTPKMLTIDWNTWISLGGSSKVQGTNRVVSAHHNLSDFLQKNIGHIQYSKETNEVFYL